MRQRVQAKLRKAIRRAEHRLPGLSRVIARREVDGVSLVEAVTRFAVDPAEKFSQRKLLALLIWDIRGTQDISRAMLRSVAASDRTDVKAEYLSLCSSRKNLLPAEFSLFREVLAGGSPREQMAAIDGVSFIDSRAVRRALIGILADDSAPLEVRDRATEMLHLQPSQETAEACAKALSSPHASIRFWAAYTLGQIPVFHKSLRKYAASALERVLDDPEVAPGWWSVGREARAMIAGLRDDPGEEDRLQAEVRRVLQDSTASPEDRDWAGCYDYSRGCAT